jgi:DNA polymerase lambda
MSKHSHKRPLNLGDAMIYFGLFKLKLSPFYEQIAVCGSIRRKKTIVNDIDIAVIPKDIEKFWEECKKELGTPILGGKVIVNKKGVKKIDLKGQWVVAIRGFLGTTREILIDIYIARPECWDAFMLFLTGSAKTNKRMRAVAKARGLALSQYGLTDRKTGTLIGDQSERDIYKTLGLDWQEPEEREF